MVMEEPQSDMELDSERIPVPQVQKMIDTGNVETVNKTSSIPRIKPRLRKRALNAAILKQMEFYFGDANLSKDRFLANLIREDPYVDLNIFIRFNKIRELTTDTNRIAKAIHASTMLQVSEDGTKVCRVTPIKQKDNVDECTIYVQNLLPDVDHDWLISTFSQYGSIAYVSVPRYKSNKKIKGFAFVEFDSAESAKKCLKSFQKRGCVLPSYTSPDELLSITTFEDAEKDVTGGFTELKSAFDDEKDNKTNKEDVKNENANNVEDEDSEEQKKRKKETVEETPHSEDQGETKKIKKKKHDTENLAKLPNANDDSLDADASKYEKKKKRKQSNQTENENDVCETNGQNDEIENSHMPNKKKNSVDQSVETPIKRKRTNAEAAMEENPTDDSSDIEKKRIRTNSQSTVEENVDTEINEDRNENAARKDKKKKRKRQRKSKIEDLNYYIGLQVMAKNDWKHLRNKYLELQRSKMKQLKQHLRKTRRNQWTNYEKNKPLKEEIHQKESENANKAGVSFTPGVIVKIDMDECCTDPKGFKAELKGNASVKYIDVCDGSYQAYVRCDTQQSAQLLTQKSNEKRQMTVLEGEEERVYWEKILRDRDEKINKKVKVKQRGRDKLLKKAEKELGKHIKFDEVC